MQYLLILQRWRIIGVELESFLSSYLNLDYNFFIDKSRLGNLSRHNFSRKISLIVALGKDF